MRPVLLVIVIGWAAFWLYWLLAARNVKVGQPRWGRVGGISVTVVVLAIFLRSSGAQYPVALTGNRWLLGTGLAVWAAGLVLAVWARICIGRNWGMPMTRKEQPDLVTAGPYRAIRHPIYTGLIFGVLGTVLATTLFGLVAEAGLTGYFVYSAIREERYLVTLFPDAYPVYKARTKMLVPFVF